MSAPPTLDRFQRWMQDAILHPDGVAAGLAAAAEELEIGPAELESIVPPGPALSGLQRLGIYSRMIRLRFLESMDEDFQGVAALVGRERFRELARRYLAERPSQSHSLNQLGAAFPAWLESTDEPLEHRRLAHELALVERAILDVYEGPDSPALDVDALLALPRDRWPEVRFALSPSLRIHACEYPTNAYLSRVFAGETPPIPAPRASYVCVHRSNWRVARTDLSRAEHALLVALSEGATLGAAFESALADAPENAEDLLAGIGRTFEDWTAKQLFRSAEF